MNRIEFQNALDKHFSADDLLQLCFELGIDHEQFQKTPKKRFTRELIEYCERKKLLEKLHKRASKLYSEFPPYTPEEQPKPEPTQVPEPATTKPRYGQNRVIAIGSAIILVAAVLYFVIRFALSPSEEIPPQPPPLLPVNPIVYSANLADCRGEIVNFEGALSEALNDATSKNQPKTIRVVQRTEADWDDSELAQAILTIHGRCLNGNLRSLTIDFPAQAANQVHLLNEPETFTIMADDIFAEDIAQSAVLYAAGFYEASYQKILERAADYVTDQPSDVDLGTFFWFWGNVLLRQDKWSEAIEAYRRALKDPHLSETNYLSILHNKGYAALVPVLAGRDDESQNMVSQERTVCRSDGLEPLEETLTNDDQCTDSIQCAKMNVLYGELLLHCPRTNRLDEERKLAIEIGEAALSFYPPSEAALALNLQADIGLLHRGDDEYGDTQTIFELACDALERDPGLADPHYILGIIFSWHGQKDEAETELLQYMSDAPLIWQRVLAKRTLNQLPDIGIKDSPLPATCP